MLSVIERVVYYYKDADSEDNKGGNFKICCPFHAENSPSCWIQPDKEIFYCFGCGEGSSAIDYIIKKEEYDSCEDDKRAFVLAKKKLQEILDVPESELEVVLKKREDEVERKPLAPIDPQLLKDFQRDKTEYPKVYRGIREDIFKFYGHLFKLNSDGTVKSEWYPETTSHTVVVNGKKQTGNVITGYKCRNFPKDFRYGKIGTTGAKTHLSGQHKFKGSKNKLLIVGGENDKCAAYQMFFDRMQSQHEGDYEPVHVVSGTAGENSLCAELRHNMDFVMQYKEVYIGLDNDAAGIAATKEAVETFPAEFRQNVKLVSWSMKDPNEMLLAGKVKQFFSDFWNAKGYVPDGIKTSVDADYGIETLLLRPRIPIPSFFPEKAKKMLKGHLPLGIIVNIIADTSIGKCHGKGTPILMYDGSVKMVEEITVGEQLMGADGSPRNVLSLARGRENMYRIDQNRGMSYTVNESHILSLRAGYDVHQGSFHLNRGEVVNVSVRDYLNLQTRAKRSLKGYKADLVKLGENQKPLFDPYVIGLWLADGTTNSPEITVNYDDVEINDYLKSFCEEKGYDLNSKSNRDDKGCDTWYIRGGFVNVLRDLKLLGNKHIPHDYKFASYQDRIELLSGIIDGDGYLGNNCYDFVMKDNALVPDMVFLARSLGFTVKVTDKFSKCQDFEGDIYKRVLISGNVEKLNLKLPRKRGCRSELRKDINTAITVTPVGEGDYYGFQLDGDHLYCLEDFTVTHNTTFVRGITDHWIFHSPYKCGIVSLEETAEQYQMGLLSSKLKINLDGFEDQNDAISYLNKPEVMEVRENLRVNEYGEPRYHIIDDRDGTVSGIIHQCEILIRMYGCKLIIIDPLQDLTDGMSNEEQQKLVKWEKQVVKDGVTIINICHIRKGDKGATLNKEGKRTKRTVTEDDVAGTSTIVKSGAVNIILERDKFAEDETEKNRTYVTLSKNRHGKLTGNAGSMMYNGVNLEDYDLYCERMYSGTPKELEVIQEQQLQSVFDASHRPKVENKTDVDVAEPATEEQEYSAEEMLSMMDAPFDTTENVTFVQKENVVTEKAEENIFDV